MKAEQATANDPGDEHLRRAIELASANADDAVLLIQDSTVVVANAAFGRLLGFANGGAIGRSLADLFGTNAQSETSRAGLRLQSSVRRREKTFDAADRIAHQNGSLLLVRFDVEPLDGSGDPTLLRIRSAGDSQPLADVSDELALHASSEAIWNWDLITDKVVWNKSVLNLFGFSPDDVEPTADWWYSQIHPDDAERVIEGIHRAIDGAVDAWSDEYRFRRADGRWAEVLDRGTIMRDASGRGARMIGAMQDVTELRVLSRHRTQIEARHRALTRALAQIVWRTDATGAVEDLPEWRAYTGQSAGEIRGSGWLEALHPDDREATSEAWVRATESKGAIPYATSYRLRGADGEYRWFEARGVPIVEDDGSVREWVGVCIDIDARKRAEAALQESEEQFRTLADSIPQLAWMADSGGSIFWYNQRWYDYTGTTFEEMEGWKWQSVHDPDHLDRVVAVFRDAIERGVAWEDTFPLRAADGEYRWFLSRAHPIRDAGGTIVRWFGTNTDITIQIEAQEERDRLIGAIDSERLRLESVFENAPAAIAVTRGPDHVFASANPEFRRLLGGRAVIGMGARDAVPELDDQGFIDRMDESYRSGKPHVGNEILARVSDPTGGPMKQGYFNFVYQPLLGPDGTVEGMLTHAVNVSDQVRARKIVDAARQAAEDANRSKSDFLATMSHELRTPLNAMIGYTDLLQLGIPEAIGEQAQVQVQRIGLSAHHLLQLIEEILTFSRIEAGREEVRPTDVNLGEVVEEVSAIIDPLAGGKELEFTIELPDTVPALVADPRKLRQILVNLLGNAVKFTEKGSITLAIEADAESVVFVVRDTGIGIPRRSMKTIFEPFRQVEGGRTNRPDGAGLGLSVSKRLAGLMGGELSVRSRIGVGSEFTLSLPGPG